MEGGAASLPPEEVEKTCNACGAEPVGPGPYKVSKRMKGSKPAASERMYQDLTDLGIDESSPRAKEQ